jgi:hypothetical protein
LTKKRTKPAGHRQTGSGTQPFVAGGTSWSVKNDTKYERIWKINVPEQSSQSMSIQQGDKLILLKQSTNFQTLKVGASR